MITGTPLYMSPEQARGEAIDGRSDLFSLGSVMYAMCTGRAPFRADTSYGILRRITDTEPRPIRQLNPDIPDWLAAVIAKLHAKAPAQRFSSADELARLLEVCLAHVQQPTINPLPEAIVKLAQRDELADETLPCAASRPSALPGRRGRNGKPASRRALLASLMAGGIVLAIVAGIAIGRYHGSRQPAQDTAAAPPPDSNRSWNEPLQPAAPAALLDGASGRTGGILHELSDLAAPMKYEFDFRGGNFDSQRLFPVGGVTLHGWTLLHPEADGLRITVPAYQDKKQSTLGVAPAITIHGDFQITAECELLTNQTPASAGPAGAQISLMSQRSLHVASLLRGITPEGRPVYVCHCSIRDDAGPMPVNATFPAGSRKLKLQFVRSGEMLCFHVAEAGENRFQHLTQVRFGREPIGALQIQSFTGGAQCTAESRWSRIEIRAEELQPLVIPLHAAGPDVSSEDSPGNAETSR